MSKLRRFTLGFITALLVFNLSLALPATAITDWRFYSSNDIDLHDDECQDESATGAVLLAGEDNEQKILNFFMRKGLNLAQAAGLVGNMMVESNLQPNIIEGGRLVPEGESYTMQNGVGFGLVQWTFTARQAPLQAFVDDMGVSNTDLGGQLGFVWEELNGGWLGTLNKLRAVDDPMEAAVIVHDEYEVSAQSPAQVRATRGENAKKIYEKYRDAPALAGAGAEDELQNPGGSPDGPEQKSSQANKKRRGCTEASFAGGNFNETLKHYAWNEWKGMTIEATPEYKEATARARSEGRYIGGIAHPGIDCGGFTTLLITDSGYDKGFNYEGKGGPTSTQAKWASENWQTLGESSTIDESTLQPGDVAISSSHTFIYVGDVEGFGAKIASASLDERAPMADTAQQATQPGFTWYRKK